MKRYIIFLLIFIFLLGSLAGCGTQIPATDPTDATVGSVPPSDDEPVYNVNQKVWDRTFSEDGLVSLLESYTVTNLLEGGSWETAVTSSRVSRLSKTNEGELVAGAILANGDNGVIQFTYSKDTGWEQGEYGETDTVEQYVTEITQSLIEDLQVLSGQFESASWDEQQAAYIVEVEIPYDGPSLADPSLETPTLRTFEVFFVNGKLSKINVMEGQSKAVVHSFGTTPIPELPEI